MRITERELGRYRRQIAARQDDARAYVLARLQREARGMNVADAREASIAVMEDCLSVFGDQAQALSAELFDEICEAEGIDAAQGAMFDDVIDRSRLADKAHYFAGKLVDGDWDGYAGSNADLAAYYVHRSALENMSRNCYENGVKYARVPTGRETCSWCYMLASRDFDYNSERSAAAASHSGCDCVVVPGVKGKTRIDGYDPDGIGRRMGIIEKQTGLTFGDDRKQMDALTREMRSMNRGWLYRGKPDGIRGLFESDGLATGSPITIYDKDDKKTLADELEGYSRILSASWGRYAARGKTSEAYREECASKIKELAPGMVFLDDFCHLEAKEVQEAVWLAKSGHMVLFRNPEQHLSSDRNTSDVLVDGETCDFKKITSNNISKVVKRVTAKLDRQGPYFLVDLSESQIEMETARARLSELIDGNKIRGIYLVCEGKMLMIDG